MSEKDSQCIACGWKLRAELRDVFDTRFGIEKFWDIGRCVVCGNEQTTPFPSPGDLKQLYETYYNFGGEKGTVYTGIRARLFSSILYPFWLNIDGDISFHTHKGLGRLLDVGCNEGRGLNIYKRNGFDAEGLQLNERAAAEARRAGFNVYTEPLEDFEPQIPFDVLVLSNVLEHTPRPREMLSHAFRILKPGGRVWISCPNSRSWLRSVFGRNWINWHVPFHLFHFSRDTLGELLRGCGFELKSVKYATPSHWVSQSVLAAMFAKPGRQTRQLRSPILVASLMIFCRLVLFPLLWVGNLTGRGDCLVVEGKKDLGIQGLRDSIY